MEFPASDLAPLSLWVGETGSAGVRGMLRERHSGWECSELDCTSDRGTVTMESVFVPSLWLFWPVVAVVGVVGAVCWRSAEEDSEEDLEDSMVNAGTGAGSWVTEYNCNCSTSNTQSRTDSCEKEKKVTS